MADNNRILSDGFRVYNENGSSEIYDIIPPSPASDHRGGIIANTKTDNDTVEVKIGEDGKAYVPTYPNAEIVSIKEIEKYGATATENIGDTYHNNIIYLNSDMENPKDKMFVVRPDSTKETAYLQIVFVSKGGTNTHIMLYDHPYNQVYLYIFKTPASILIYDILNSSVVSVLYDDNGDYLSHETSDSITTDNMVEGLNSLLKESEYIPTEDTDIVTKSYVDEIDSKIVQVDWSQDDENSLDYIKGRTHYFNKIEIFNDNITLKMVDSYNGRYNFNQPLSLEEGVTYEISINDEVSLGIGFRTTPDSSVFIATNINCNILIAPDGITIEYPEVTSFNLTIKAHNYIKLDEKYIPDSIARESSVHDVHEQISSVGDMVNMININKQNKSDLVTEINEFSTDVQYPSAKAVYNYTTTPKDHFVLIDRSTKKEYAVFMDNGEIAYQSKEAYELEQSLIDFEYIVEEDGTYTLTAWKGTYNGEPSDMIVVPDSELINI